MTEKAVCYFVQDDHLLVFTHLQHPMHITGVQVPSETIDPAETPSQAAERGLYEETGLEGIVSRELDAMAYDMRPTREEIANRHFLGLKVPQQDLPQRWIAGE
ncbi:NUDIX domain-containing protein [Arthrobacter sp. TMN-49]